MEKLKSGCHSEMQKLKLAFSLYFSGVRDACCIHRALFFCRRSQKIFLRTAQCFLLNGLIFLGIHFFVEMMVAPITHWILTYPLAGEEKSDRMFIFETFLLLLCNGLLVLPLYALSYGASFRWYNEIAQEAFMVLDCMSHTEAKEKQAVSKTTQHQQGSQGNKGLDGIFFNFGEQTYCAIMLGMFYLEGCALSFLPYVGNCLAIPLRIWLYAYYFFDYKWAYDNWSLEKRLTFFETNWAFFAGFGSPCVFATLTLSNRVQNGIFAFLLPLFVLVAFGSRPELVMNARAGEGARPKLSRIPIFYFASVLMNKVLHGIGSLFGSKEAP